MKAMGHKSHVPDLNGGLMEEEVFGKKVLPLFTLSIVVTFVSSFIGLLFLPIFSNIIAIIVLAIVGIVCLVVLLFRPSIPLLLVFNAIEGLVLTSLVYDANIVDPLIIPEAFGITALTFTAFSLISYKSSYNFASWGKALFVLLIAGVIISLLQFFIQSSIVNIAIDFGMVLLFVGFTLYDVKNILENYSDDQYINASVALYLDFINIFVRIVDILMRLRERD